MTLGLCKDGAAPQPPPTTGETYKLGEDGENSCPHAFSRIVSKIDCEVAAAFEKREFKAVMDADQKTRPAGCYCGGNNCRFNPDPVGAPFENSAPLCKRDVSAETPAPTHETGKSSPMAVVLICTGVALLAVGTSAFFAVRWRRRRLSEGVMATTEYTKANIQDTITPVVGDNDHVDDGPGGTKLETLGAASVA